MSIVDNKKAFFDYFIEDRFEAGLELEGWEVKAIRSGRAGIKEAYVRIIRSQVWLVGANISPLNSASTHVRPDAIRMRRCLLHREEINKLIGKVKEKGYTLIPINLHFSKGRVKLEIGLAKGKKDHDKRATIKEREGKQDAAQAMKKAVRVRGEE
jgi:SsrA-binding protein